MITKGQHRGHCQVCGRIQVVLPSGNIAKHGYRVAGFHFFNGVCYGSEFEPLQLSREECDSIVRQPIEGAYRTMVAKKDALDKLNREYSKLRGPIMDNVNGDAYYSIPFDLHAWRERHSETV